MSELLIRSLAQACAPRIAARVEAVVVQTVRDALPDVLADVLREQYQGETLRIYAAKRPASARRDRDAAIRAQYNGRNVKELAASFGLSAGHIFRIVAGGR